MGAEICRAVRPTRERRLEEAGRDGVSAEVENGRCGRRRKAEEGEGVETKREGEAIVLEYKTAVVRFFPSRFARKIQQKALAQTYTLAIRAAIVVRTAIFPKMMTGVSFGLRLPRKEEEVWRRKGGEGTDRQASRVTRGHTG